MGTLAKPESGGVQRSLSRRRQGRNGGGEGLEERRAIVTGNEGTPETHGTTFPGGGTTRVATALLIDLTKGRKVRSVHVNPVRAGHHCTSGTSSGDGNDDGGGGGGGGGGGDTTDTPRLSSAILPSSSPLATLIPITDTLPLRTVTVSPDTLRLTRLTGLTGSDRQRAHSREYVSRELYVRRCRLRRSARVRGTRSLVASPRCLEHRTSQTGCRAANRVFLSHSPLTLTLAPDLHQLPLYLLVDATLTMTESKGLWQARAAAADERTLLDLLGRGKQAGLLESGVGGDGDGRLPLSGAGGDGWGYNGPCGAEVYPRTAYKRTASARGWSRRGGGWRSDGGPAGARAGAPVTARYGSLGDRCRYRVAVSPESVAHDFPLHHVSLALESRSGGMESGPLSPTSRGRASARPLAGAARSLATLSSATGGDAALKGGSIDRAKHGGIHHPSSRYPGSLVTWRNGSRRGYMGV
ncbi:hypothetical protein DBV15_05269 [Temnothorax longispinosus]|uniref:Uncharacterized protein n=1 Tax=Temnothorax longispinosus TaxID=300112 RepID=A0A4S2JP56_9HYME|nr:hypothetical protein DBV15_05269 [Temnothorax longispinosus]